VPSRIPESAFATVTMAQMCDIGRVIPEIAKIFDPFGEVFASLQMAGSMPITLGSCVN